jgi:hypothetical protein
VGFEDRQDILAHKSGRMTTHYSAAELGNLVAAVNRITNSHGSHTGTVNRAPFSRVMCKSLKVKMVEREEAEPHRMLLIFQSFSPDLSFSTNQRYQQNTPLPGLFLADSTGWTGCANSASADTHLGSDPPGILNDGQFRPRPTADSLHSTLDGSESNDRWRPEGLDLAIRIGVLEDSLLVARKLAPSRFIVCASPSLPPTARHATGAYRSRRTLPHDSVNALGR